MKKEIYLFVIIAFLSGKVNAQFTITSDTNTIQLVNDFILSGVSASNVLYTGAPNTLGSFTNGSMTNIGLPDGIVMTTGVLSNIANPVSYFASTDNSTPGDADLQNILGGYPTFDASVLEFDLIPVGNVLEFQYVFASEEYPEYVCSSYNDVFGFFISGPNPSGGNYTNENIALIPGTTLPVAINTINQGNIDLNYPNADCMSINYSSDFVYNQALGGTTISFDGFTTVLHVHAYVVPSNLYHLKMAIADVGDGIFDSGIFLKAQSMKSYNETTSINEQEYDATIVFPNPVNDNIEISLYGNSEIQIINAEGQVVKRMNINDTHASIDISALSNGIYFLKMKNENGISVKKFVKE